jgi:hypothetical protein
MEKSLSSLGKKIKLFILIDMAKNQYDTVKKNNFFWQTYFFGKLYMQTKNYSFWTNIGSKTPIIDFSAQEFFVEMTESDVFF